MALSCQVVALQENMRNVATCDSKRLMRCPDELLVTMLCLNLYVHLQQRSGSQVSASVSCALLICHQALCTTAVQLHMPRSALMAWRFIAECVACKCGALLVLLCISALRCNAGQERGQNHKTCPS